MKAPAMMFYPGDWRKDLAVQALGYFDRGVWFEMLCLMHESDERGVLLVNGKPVPDDVAANLLRLDLRTFKRSVDKILELGVARRRELDGALYSKRMVADERLNQIRRAAGKKGGNPDLVKRRPTIGANQNPTPSSSDTDSSSDDTEAIEVLTYLNGKAGSDYRPVPANLRLIRARLEEGATVANCKRVIDAKVAVWGTDPKMAAYLRPKTLFNATNFANYAGEAGIGGAPIEEGWE